MHMSSDPFAWNAAQRQDVSYEKSPFVRTGLKKKNRHGFPCLWHFGLAEKWGFEPQIPLWGILT